MLPALDPIFLHKNLNLYSTVGVSRHVFTGVKTNLGISLFCGHVDESASHNADISCDVWRFCNPARIVF